MQTNEIRTYILENVAGNPAAIVSLVTAKFGVSPMTVHRHLQTLIKNGKLIKSGTTKNTKYFLQDEYDRQKIYNIENTSAEDKMFRDFADIFSRFAKNIYEICSFGVTEMLNNAIDHSRGSKITLQTIYREPELTIIVKDNGVGAFKTICDYLNFNDLREGIVHISKGKITRDPINHTGQGIFFTSRMFDKFIIDANDLVYEKDNAIQDWTFWQRAGGKGTTITMTINVHAATTCKQIFSMYEGEEHAFDKTEFIVQLADFKETSFVSRSQAKRILFGLDKFSLITFDFKRVEFIGQGFVDEIFRIFLNNHPDIRIQYINANEAVRFMIERGSRARPVV
jgi:anti-sigma regulatory factor (Ser/Thr protein kinase)